MAQGLSRTRFNSSRLVRVLSDLVVADIPPSRQSFAERLGQWVDFKDALALFPVLNGATGGAAHGRSAASSSEAAAAKQAFLRVRDTLKMSIETDGVRGPGKARIELPMPNAAAPGDGSPDFAPYQRYYLAHQRDMAASIGTLRSSLRSALMAGSTGQRRLAALDAVMDQALAGRERDLLATVPGLLARRFEQCCREHEASPAETQALDRPQEWVQPGRWLAEFCREMRAVLLAELDLRLQPVAGLVAALDNMSSGKQ